jgi:hypothetical protein
MFRIVASAALLLLLLTAASTGAMAGEACRSSISPTH